MSKLLYLEGAGGISGDMTVAALLDLGADRNKLHAVLASLNLEGVQYRISRKKSYGLEGCDFDVVINEPDHHGHPGHHEPHAPHEHPGHPEPHTHPGHHEHHEPHGHHEPHEHRNLADVYKVLDRGEMTDRARELAHKIFRIVAEAEAKAHGCGIDEVHFHEVGAVDSIADIAAAAGFSPNYLSRRFREAAGFGVHEYLTFIRLRSAAHELASTADSVTEVALRCGFSNSNYFKDAFKKQYGCTPRAYRQRAQGEC